MTLRNQCELYRVQHGDQYPWEVVGHDNEEVIKQLTTPTNTLGEYAESDEGGKLKFGPYLERMPTNLFVQATGGAGDKFDFQDGKDGLGSAFGWYVDKETNKIYANSPEEKYSEHWDF